MSRRGSAAQIAAMAAIPETERCRALIRFNMNGASAENQRCRRKAQADGYCNLPAHRDSAKTPRVESADGGWCIWCGEPGRRYTCPRAKLGVDLTLCVKCGQGLLRELRHQLTIIKRRTA
jgi:hypothetical protein